MNGDLQFDAATHTYRMGGTVLPSVTQVLSILGGYEGIPDSVMASKADLGDAVHFATELFDRDVLDEASMPDSVAGYVSSYIRFRKETGFTPLAMESRVYSVKHKYAGTLDRTGVFTRLCGVKHDAVAIVDLKCTYKLMPTVGPQTAAYAFAFREQTGCEIRHRFALQLKPDGTYRLEECTERTDMAVFLSALNLTNWKLRNKT